MIKKPELLNTGFDSLTNCCLRDFTSKEILPKEDFYNEATRDYILKKDDVRKADDPDKMLLNFFETTYEVGASLAGRDRRSLERNFH